MIIYFYLHYLDIKVIAPELDSEEKIASSKAIEFDGFSLSNTLDEAGELSSYRDEAEEEGIDA